MIRTLLGPVIDIHGGGQDLARASSVPSSFGVVLTCIPTIYCTNVMKHERNQLRTARQSLALVHFGQPCARARESELLMICMRVDIPSPRKRGCAKSGGGVSMWR